jgi:hypothetical protein
MVDYRWELGLAQGGVVEFGAVFFQLLECVNNALH